MKVRFEVHSNLVFFFNFQITKIRSNFDIVTIIDARKKKFSGPSDVRCHENRALQELQKNNIHLFLFQRT